MSFALRPNHYLLGFELTGHCDLRCKHCLRADLSTVVELELGLFCRVLDEACELGPPHVAFTGGEVTLHPRFFDFLRAVADRELTCHFVTNGNSYPRIREELRGFEGTVAGISISLDGASRAVHDRVRGRGSYERAVMAIALATGDGFQVTVQMAVHGQNRHEIEAMAVLCRDLGVSLLVYAHTQPTERASRNGLGLDPDAWLALDQEVEAIGRATEMPVMLSAGHYDPNPMAHCQTLRHQSFNVDCHGRLTFCCQLSGVEGSPKDLDVIADLNEVPFHEALEAHVAMSHEITRDRLRHIKANPDDPHRAFHCHYCLERFGKLAHLGQKATEPAPGRELRHSRPAERRLRVLP